MLGGNMKILERGTSWSIEQYCTGKGNGDSGCNSRLLVGKNDIFLTSNIDGISDVNYSYSFKCPICGTVTNISNKDLSELKDRNLLEVKKESYTRKRKLD